MDNYLDINRQSWNSRLEAHLASDFYDMTGFMEGKSSLNETELGLLGDISGKSILHLQCHFGQDTISLSRMGADVVGIDLSDQSIAKAQELAVATGSTARFVCSDVYSLPDVLHEQFDIVFTSYGVISWLPDLDRWAGVIRHFLKHGGRFVFAEFHPAVWMYDDAMETIAYHYNNVAPIDEEEQGTYADKEAQITQRFICWNHGIGEVVNSLISKGLAIKQLNEYSYAHYDFIADCEEFVPKRYRVKKFGDKFPLMYALEASLPVD